ncbi:MAG: four helix bundle protein [Candidatus Moraniibacteriota bacterium]
MGKINNFYDLDVWKKSHLLVLEIYGITKDFPKSELYGVISQLQRAASSITANIAEGFARYHFKDKIKFYYNSRGSTAEVQNFLLLAKDLNYIDQNKLSELEEKIIEINKLLNGLIRSTELQIK